MKTKVVTVSTNGIKIGDLVVMNRNNTSYGRVIKIYTKTYEAHDWQVTYKRYGRNRINAGDTISSLTINRMLNLDLSTSKRKSTVTIDDDKVVLISKDFISKMFKKLNDLTVYVKMINEQEGLV